MGIEKIDAYICTCDNCGEVFTYDDLIPSTGDEVEIDNMVRNDGEWIKDNGKYYCTECYEIHGEDYFIK